MDELEKKQEIEGKGGHKKQIVFLSIAVAIMILGIGLYFVMRPKVTSLLVVEAGSDMPKVTDFLLHNYTQVEVVSGLDDDMMMNRVGDYEVVVRVYNKEYTSVLRVEDTVSPKVQCQDVMMFLGQDLQIEDFKTQIEDATSTTITYKKIPTVTMAGQQEVTLLVSDGGNNVTQVTATLTIIDDNEAPSIEGVAELTVYAGESISYKRGVTVVDDYDENPELTIDNSQVDIYHPGEYVVIYTATDVSGNSTSVESKVIVKMPPVEEMTEELIYAWADERLALITTEDMTLYEKAYAIFDWVHHCIGWNGSAPKDSWIQGAYYGLIKQCGDCYTYAMTSKVLLTRAGIPNMDIKKIPARTEHYWNLIDLGDGWYHFDACRRADGRIFFYVSDEELMEYSNSHGGTHNYDPSLYPEIQ